MLSFATEFPVNHEHDSTAFIIAVREWILGSPHTELSPDDLAEIDGPGEWSARKSNERVDSLKLGATGEDAAAVRYTKHDRVLEWVTTAVFSRQRNQSWIGIQVSCESRHPAARLPVAKKPVVVRTLLNRLGGGADGPLMVQTTPVRLSDADIDLAARCISGRASCRLPIVYVSAMFQGGHIVDVDSLANELGAMAHVLVEPNRPFSLRLKLDVDSQNVYGGTIGIYWPDGGGRRSFFIGPGFDSADEIRHATFEEVRTALTNRRPQRCCTWASVQEAVSRRALNALKDQGSTQLDRYIEEFDKELKAKEERLADAEKEISRLKAEVRKYEARSPMGSGVVLRTGQEQDLYDGELAQIIRDALSDASTRVPKDSRRNHVLTSILSANDSDDGSGSKRERLKALLRGFTNMDAKTRRGLIELGFTIAEEGKHYKVTFQGDDRYTFALPKSGSDHRGGLNAAADISRLLF